MFDRLNIDRSNNNITIHVGSRDLSQMTEPEIMQWLSKFITQISETNMKQGKIKDQQD